VAKALPPPPPPSRTQHSCDPLLLHPTSLSCAHPSRSLCLQLLMGASEFCALMHVLALLSPGVDPKRFPTVASYGRFGAALLTSTQDQQQQQQEEGDRQDKGELLRAWQDSPPKGGRKGKVGDFVFLGGAVFCHPPCCLSAPQLPQGHQCQGGRTYVCWVQGKGWGQLMLWVIYLQHTASYVACLSVLLSAFRRPSQQQQQQTAPAAAAASSSRCRLCS
jgi:hypothetical protein